VRMRNLRGVILGYLGRFDESDEELSRALVDSAHADRSTPPSLIIGNLANLAVRRVQAEKAAGREVAVANAEKRISEALAISLSEKSAEAEIRAWYNCGLLRAAQADWVSARDAFRRSLEIALVQRHRSRVIDARIELGIAENKLEKFEAAIVTFDTAYTEADAARPSKQLHVACQQLADIYETLGRHREAAHARAKAERERAEYERERENAGRELRMFWQEIGEMPATPSG